MADISNELASISSAKYGEEVRGSIVNAIRKINDIVDESEVSDLTSVSTAFLDKIYKNERILGYDTGKTGYDALVLESNTAFASVIVPIRFNIGSGTYSYIKIPFKNDSATQSQVVFYNKNRNPVFNKMYNAENGFVTIDLNDLYTSGITDIARIRYVAFSTTGPLYSIEYHNVLDPESLNYESINTDAFVKDVRFNAFVAAYDTETKKPIYSTDAYFNNYITLTVKVRPTSASRIVYSYHYAGQVSGICPDGNAQVLFLDNNGDVILNKTFDRNNNKVAITFSTEDELRASYVMFSTDSNPSDVEYHNVLDPESLNYESINTDAFVKDVRLSTLVIGYNLGNKTPVLSTNPYFNNYITLTVKVRPTSASRIVYSYHYAGQVSGTLPNGNAQVLFLDENGDAYANKEIVRNNNKITITFDNANELKASYVMFSTDSNPSDVEYHNVLDPESLSIEASSADYSDMIDFSMFNRIACLGDSYTAGAICKPDGSYLDYTYQNPWPTLIGKRFDIDVNNYGIGGSMTKTYWEDHMDPVLSGEKADCYLYCWGLNDTSTDSYHTGLWDNLPPEDRLGTEDDIVDSDSATPKNTFYGYYSSIIMKCKAHAPKARHIIIGMPRTTSANMTNEYIQASSNIADHLGIAFIDLRDDQFFYTQAFSSMNGGHPTRMGYSGMARAITRLFSKCVVDNVAYFKDVIVD